MSRSRPPLALLLSFTLLSGFGCGPPKPVAVTGSVTWDGSPLPAGTVTFVSDDAAPQTLPVAEGRYSGSVTPGKKRVEVRAPDAKRPAARPSGLPGGEAAAQEGKNYLPGRYNTATELGAEVKAGGENVFDFRLTK